MITNRAFLYECLQLPQLQPHLTGTAGIEGRSKTARNLAGSGYSAFPRCALKSAWFMHNHDAMAEVV